ncbi:FbpB family small basic protein [Bacillus sp. sid0103]|nr:FbpB family small basic protein [Bacillus sp. sid0103]MBV7505617.1 FbpB family small basic protein [Bacillus sp. sid0103]
MRKRKLIFKELVNDNKKEIKSDFKALERIEAKIDDKHAKRLIFS